jgi:hypothetical protein
VIPRSPATFPSTAVEHEIAVVSNGAGDADQLLFPCERLGLVVPLSRVVHRDH